MAKKSGLWKKIRGHQQKNCHTLVLLLLRIVEHLHLLHRQSTVGRKHHATVDARVVAVIVHNLVAIKVEEAEQVLWNHHGIVNV